MDLWNWRHMRLQNTLAQDFTTLENNHDRNYFIFTCDDLDVNGRNTVALSKVIRNVYVIDWPPQHLSGGWRIVVWQKLSQVQRFLLDDPAFFDISAVLPDWLNWNEWEDCVLPHSNEVMFRSTLGLRIYGYSLTADTQYPFGSLICKKKMPFSRRIR